MPRLRPLVILGAAGLAAAVGIAAFSRPAGHQPLSPEEAAASYERTMAALRAPLVPRPACETAAVQFSTIANGRADSVVVAAASCPR